VIDLLDIARPAKANRVSSSLSEIHFISVGAQLIIRMGVFRDVAPRYYEVIQG